MEKKYWKKYNGAIIPNIAPHSDIQENESQIRKLIKDTGSFFARWTSDFDCSETGPCSITHQVEIKGWFKKKLSKISPPAI